MKVLLAGATGTIGLTLTSQLVAAGHEVLGLTRSAAGARRLTERGATGVQADMMDPAALRTALEGQKADAVIHEATALKGTPVTHRDLFATDALRKEGTANLLRAARQLGAHRFLTQSFIFGYGYADHGQSWLTEDLPFGEPGRGGFNRHLDSMRANEEQVLNAEGVDGIALRYGMFYGAEPSTLQLLGLARRRLLPRPRHSGLMSPIHIEDAAAATVAALEHGRGGHAYNVVDDQPVTWSEYLAAVAWAAGAPTPWRVPGWLLRTSPYIGTLMTATSLRVANGKARRELGWTPTYPTCRDGLAAVVAGTR